MSIKTLKKITLYGLASEKEAVLSGLQEMGCVHLIPLAETPAAPEGELSEPRAAKEAYSHLLSCPVKRREIRRMDAMDTDEVVAKVLANKNQLRAASDARDNLIKRIQEVRPWGDFSFPELNQLDDIRLWFYVIPHHDMAALEDIEMPWEVVHRDHKNCYVVLLNKTEPDANLLPVKRSRVGGDSLSSLEHQLEEAEMKVEDIQGERESLTRWLYVLSQIVARKEDTRALEDARRVTLDDDQFFLVSGWLPADEEERASEFVASFAVAATIEDPAPEDSPPTLLENPESVAGGTEAMAFYQLPGYRTWDPSTVVFFSFSLFFAMIMNDAAYCAILGGLVFLFRKKLGASETGIRIRNLAYFMSGIGILWGIGSGSYFGYTPDKETFFGSLHFIDMNNYGAMMKLSIIIGATHIVIANLVTAWNNRTRLYVLAPLGWTLAIIGGVTLWLGMTGDLAPVWKETLGPALAIVGAALIFLFTSTRPVSSAKDVLFRIVDGLHALYNISSVFGDILSYMRLFALGLAGASLAVTFNTLAFQVLDSMPGIGVLFCALILIAGHLLNISLSLMGGVVHGLRLNVIEFFKWSLTEEGYPFKPFKKQED